MRILIGTALCLFLLSTTAWAAITATGDVDPANPSTWNSSTWAYIGKTSTGTLDITSGSTVNSHCGKIGNYADSTGTVTVDGTNSTWTNVAGITIGQDLTGTGKLIINNGGTVTAGSCVVGVSSTSANELTVDGADSRLDTSGNTYIGMFGTATMKISDGGVVSNADGYIGHTYATINSVRINSTGTVTVEGTGSTWTNDGDLYVGDRRNGTLYIQDGGTVENNEGYIGHYNGSTGKATVDGAGSTWTMDDILGVGFWGDGTLEITDGGSVSNTDSYIGYVGATGTVTVGEIDSISENESTWTNSGRLYIALSSTGTGTLNIYDKGCVEIDGFTLKANGIINLDGGTLELNGSDAATTISDWTSFDFDSGEIKVTNGADVTVGAATTLGTDQTLTVTGSSSTWDSSDYHMTVNSGGTMDIENQGSVTTAGFTLGTGGTINLDGGTLELTGDMDFYDWDGTFNFTSGEIKVSNGTVTALAAMTLNDDQLLTVTGSNSEWVNRSGLGMYVHDGELKVDNGGSVSSSHSVVGGNSSSAALATVDGAGSSWTNSGNLAVGYFGTGTLNITDGGSVNSTYGYIGLASGSTGTVNVEGASSTWTNSSSALYVGYEGTGTLNVTDGGTVENTDGYIGYFSGSTGTVTVDGTDSEWTNSDDLFVGKNGTGELEITDGGLVSVAGTLTIDADNDADSFIKMSDDGMLALLGDADDSLNDFLTTLVSGTDAIQWWDSVDEQWELLTTATEDTDYSLAYQTTGDLTGYTLLTVMAEYTGGARAMMFDWGDGGTAAVPEPSTVALILTALATFGIAVMRKRNRK